MPASASLRVLFSAVFLGVAVPRAAAQAPSIAFTSPQAVRPGGTTDVTLTGSNLSGPVRLWTSFPAEAVLSPDVADNGKNAGQIVYRITVPAEAPVGVHGIRVLTATGLSPIRLFVVDDLPSVSQVGNNTSAESAQVLTLPSAVDGSVANLSRNYYAIDVQAGQWLSFEVLARRLGSPLDPMLRLLDAHGRELQYNDDQPGLAGDCQITHTFPQAGRYLVEVRDIRYQGGGNHRYRLRIGDFPCVTVPYPLAAQRGTDASIHFAGSFIEGLPPLALKVPSDPAAGWINVGARFTGGQSSGFATLALSDGTELLESEPNDTPEQSNRVELGASLNGRLELPGDVDRFVFAARKGQKFMFTGITRSQGSPTDLFLQLLKADGAKLAEAEDTPPGDGAIDITFPEDGDYTLVVEDLNRRGGGQFVYRIEAAESQPQVLLSAAADHLNIPAGGTAGITVNALRKGYNGPIALEVRGLPAGAASHPTIMGPGRNNVDLVVIGTPELRAGELLAIQIVGRFRVGETEMESVATIGDALKAAGGMPWPTHVLAYAAAAAAAAESPLKLRTEPAQITFGKDLSATVKVVAERGAEIDEEIALAITPAQNGLPPGITAAVKPIPKGQNEVEIVFSGNNQAPLGEFTANLAATHKKGNVTVAQPVPGVGLSLQAPLTMSVDAAGGKLPAGGTLKVKVAVRRNPALSAPVAVTFQNLPSGVSAPATTIAADQSEVEIELTAAQDAAKGSVNNVTVKGDAVVGNVTHSGTSAAVALTVE